MLRYLAKKDNSCGLFYGPCLCLKYFSVPAHSTPPTVTATASSCAFCVRKIVNLQTCKSRGTKPCHMHRQTSREKKKILITCPLLTLLDKTCSDRNTTFFYLTLSCYICSEATTALEIRN